jgi:hypothetical protein
LRKVASFKKRQSHAGKDILAKSLFFFKKFSTAFGGRPDGGITSLCLVWASLRSPDAAKLA